MSKELCGSNPSLRSKIFNRLPKKFGPDVSANGIIESAISTVDPRHDGPDSDSSSSVDDHLVSLENIDLDSQFFSQQYPQPAVGKDQNIKPEVVSSEDESDFDEEENDRVNLMLTQLATFGQSKQLLAGTNISEKKVEDRCDAERDEDIQRVICKTEGIEDENMESTCSKKEASDDEWEQIGVYEPHNVDIIVSQPPNKNGKVFDVEAQLKRLLQSEQREKRSQVHCVSLLCLIGRGFHLNKLISRLISNNSMEILKILEKMVMVDLDSINVLCLKTICDIFKKVITDNHANVLNWKPVNFDRNMKNSEEWLVILFVAIMRFISIETRLVMHLNVPSKNIVPQKSKIKPSVNGSRKRNMKSSFQERYPNVPLTTTEILKRKPEFIHFSRIPQMDGNADVIPDKRTRLDHGTNESKPKLWKLRLKKPKYGLSSIKLCPPQTNRETTSSFFNRRVDVSNKKTTHKKNTRDNTKLKVSLNIISGWVEIFVPIEKRWVTVDVVSGKVDCLEDLIASLEHPIVYVFAWGNDNSLKDVTPRYWWRNEMASRKLRVDKKWLQSVTHHFGKRRKTIQDLIEELQFKQLRYQAPVPEKYSDFKNHPSYCLARDLLKFQGIYPPDIPPLGFFRSEPIYARDCVRTLHSREVWLRHAKVIRMHEQPYKVVMSKLKREKTQLELFGYWQTEDYIPPEPIDGRVPRNAYGNIEIFKDCMLPKGTVHLKQINISRICRRLKVDYAPAVVGFGLHAGGNHPVFEGIVICKQFEQQVLEEYERDQVEQERRKLEKREKVIYDRWAKLIKGLLIRNRLRNKYNFGNY
ncbi:uncharacterized protein LOC129778176 [Toxorhynchites rutilus septentrionalis]|uniref:uncharacterized protein LOC129778176 n=1 Tax=Toxorhynchites rutilus septentrionalis TaxID=329112 RepID=UPI00247B06F1|nr:uncharacterized protein LOC129778176 [Toxorhynchites rutilus septentrionalis]